MKFSLFLIILFSVINPFAEVELIKIRDLYQRAALNEAAHIKLNKLIETTEVNGALLVGYKGAGIMIGANYVFNPISKLSRFNKGKKLIEQAIEKEPKNLELRYLRLTLQTNLPKFLGYSNSINKDKGYIISQLEVTKDLDLRNRILAYLVSSKICTAEELKIVTTWKNK